MMGTRGMGKDALLIVSRNYLAGFVKTVPQPLMIFAQK